MNKKGFTLIELLAVIIILGILMIIAIPSVTRYINDSRKSAYVDTATEIVSGVRNLVNSGDLGMYDTNTTYYIPSSYIKTENASKSPYGEFTEAYIGVIYNGNGYNYYWISVDDAGQGIDEITPIGSLDIDDIKSDLNGEDIEYTVKSIGIGNRENIKVLNNETGLWDEYSASGHTPEKGNDNSKIEYPDGKSKSDLTTGDVVKIDNEEFYVMFNEDGDLTLLAKYNLYVGTVTDEHWNKIRDITSDEEGYGRQKSIAKGWVDGEPLLYGITPFSDSQFWTIEGNRWKYIYYDNPKIKKYVDDYANSLGVTYKDARLMTIYEANDLGCSADCTTAPSFIIGQSYWLGNACGNDYVAIIADSGYYNCYGYANDYFFGIRPVIVI